MGLSIKRVEETIIRLRRMEEKTHKRILRRLRRAAIDIRDLARDNAPVDLGNLENAIEDIASREGNREVRYVGVNPDKLGDGYQVNGFRYDIAMHIGIVNGEPYELGPRSRAKQNTGKDVGPFYLERAAKSLTPGIQADINRILSEVTRE